MPRRFVASTKLLFGLLLVFVALSAADLLLTWALLHRPGGRFLESNPVAAWSLATYGWGGMAALKAGSVLVVGGLAWAIALRRPQTALVVLGFSCGALATTVLQSLLLGLPADGQRPGFERGGDTD